MKLEWDLLPRQHHLAKGASDEYLIIVTHDTALLTRWQGDNPLAASGAEKARAAGEAARNAIRLGGAYGSAAPVSVIVRHFKDTAQAYESGIDIEDEPRWRH